MKFSAKKITLIFILAFTTVLSYGAVIQPLSGTHSEAGNQIEWSVDVVDNIDFFIIQRSNDGVHFFSIAIKTISSETDYDFFDMKGTKTAFYRVMKVNKDGVGIFSTSIALN